MRIIKLLIPAALALTLFAACIDQKPDIRVGVTPEPSARAVVKTPEPMEVPDYFTPVPTAAPMSEVDDKGVRINGAEHFVRYLTFQNLYVYEVLGDTFLDGVVKNTYSSPIVCAVDIVYYDDDGEELARARLQTRDGNYLLKLQPGETVVFARILTDMTLTDRDFTLEFDTSVGVYPTK